MAILTPSCGRPSLAPRRGRSRRWSAPTVSWRATPGSCSPSSCSRRQGSAACSWSSRRKGKGRPSRGGPSVHCPRQIKDPGRGCTRGGHRARHTRPRKEKAAHEGRPAVRSEVSDRSWISPTPRPVCYLAHTSAGPPRSRQNLPLHLAGRAHARGACLRLSATGCDLRHGDEPPVGITSLAGADAPCRRRRDPPVTSIREPVLGLVLTVLAFFAGAGAGAAVLAGPPSAFEARPQAVWAIPPVLAR